jgi:hypothetical protein
LNWDDVCQFGCRDSPTSSVFTFGVDQAHPTRVLKLLAQQAVVVHTNISVRRPAGGAGWDSANIAE